MKRLICNLICQPKHERTTIIELHEREKWDYNENRVGVHCTLVSTNEYGMSAMDICLFKYGLHESCC